MAVAVTANDVAFIFISEHLLVKSVRLDGITFCARVTVSATPICHNWRYGYIISLSKGPDALKGQAAVVAAKEIVHRSGQADANR
jgi:hypothetical protein